MTAKELAEAITGTHQLGLSVSESNVVQEVEAIATQQVNEVLEGLEKEIGELKDQANNLIADNVLSEILELIQKHKK